ncbi:MAG: leucyl/phenylalanyl-tRNA--protein transferase [Campylobacterales bacterium]
MNINNEIVKKSDENLPYSPFLNYSMFPPAEYADSDGFLAISRDLGLTKVIDAYSNGIFPWFKDGDFFCWFSPPKRAVLEFDNFKLSRSLKKKIRKIPFNIKADTAFESVIDACSKATRKHQEGSWIDKDFKNTYISLHKQGLCHSIECYDSSNALVGGLYGVSFGKMFVGESMFSISADSSKIALFYLNGFLKEFDFEFIDAQIQNEHLKSLGVKEIDRDIYLKRLKNSLTKRGLRGHWAVVFDDFKKSFEERL